MHVDTLRVLGRHDATLLKACSRWLILVFRVFIIQILFDNSRRRPHTPHIMEFPERPYRCSNRTLGQLSEYYEQLSPCATIAIN